MQTWLTLLLVAVTYVGVAAGRLPALKANRTTIALMGAGALVAFGLVRFETIGALLDLDALFLWLTLRR